MSVIFRSLLAWSGFLCLTTFVQAQEAGKNDKLIEPAPVNLGRPVDFEKDIFPILEANCIACHNVAIKENNLNLEEVPLILKGGKRGPAVVAKDPDKSLLYLVARRSAPAMPPLPNKVEAAALTPQELGLLRQWIVEGAAAGEGGGMAEVQWQAIPATAKAIYTSAVSADGQYVACGRANQIFVYHIPTGQLVARLVDPNLKGVLKDGKAMYSEFAAHRDYVHSLAFSPDGLTLASGDFRAVKIWQRKPEAKRFEVAAGAPVNAVATSADNAWLAMALANNQVKLVKVATGEAGPVLNGHTGPVTSLMFSPDNTKIVTGSADKSLRIWNVADGALVSRIDTPAAVNVVIWNQDGTQLISGGADNQVRAWAVPTVAAKALASVPNPLGDMAVSFDRKWIALAHPDGKIDIIDATTGQVARSLQGHQGAVLSLNFSQQAPRLVSGGADKTIRVWDYTTGQPVALLQGAGEGVSGVALSPNGNQAVSGTTDGKSTVWKLDVPAIQQQPSDAGQPALITALSPDGRKLAIAAVAEGKPAIQVRDLGGGVTHHLVGHEGPVTAVAFSADAARIISGSADKTARVWNLGDSKEVAKFAAHTNTVTAVAFTPNGQQAVSGAADNSLKLWNVADGAEQKNFAGHSGAVSAVLVHPNGQVLSASADQTIRVWNPGDGSQIRSIAHGQAVSSLALTRDGNRIAATGTDPLVKVYNFGDGAAFKTYTGHAAPAKTVDFSTDNTRLVSTGADNVAAIWDVNTGDLLEKLPVPAGITFARFAQGQPNVLVYGQADKALFVATTLFERLLPGHTKVITDVLYNRGGDAVYTASDDGQIRRFAVANAQMQFAANQGAPVWDIDLSPDGNWLASASENKEIRVWNAGNGGGAPKPQLQGFEAPVRSVAFLMNGQKIVGGAANNQVLAFDLQTGLANQAYLEHQGSVEAIAAVGDQGQFVISTGADKTIRQWPFTAGVMMVGHAQPITALALMLPPNGQVLSGAGDNQVRQWNLANGQQIRAFDQGGAVTAVVCRPDGQQIATAGVNNLIRLFNPGNGQLIADIRGDVRAQRLVAKLTADDQENKARINTTTNAVKAAETDLTAKTEAAKKATEAQTTAAAAVPPMEAKVKEATDKLAAAQKALDDKKDDQNLLKAKTDAEKVLTDAQAELKKVQDAKTAADKNLAEANRNLKDATDLLAKNKADADKAVQTNMQGEAALKAAQMASTQTEKPWRSLAYSPDGKTLSAGGDDNLVHTYASADGSGLEIYAGHQGPVTAMAMTGDGLIVSGSADQTVKAWLAAPVWGLAGQLGPKPEAPLDLKPSPFVNRILAMDFSPDGKFLATGGGDPSRTGELMIWDVAQRTLVKTITDAHSDTIFGLEYSRDGKYILSGAADKFVKIFDVEQGKLVKAFEGHTNHVLDVSWRADQSIIASAGADNAVKVWSVETGEQQRTIQGYNKQVTGLQFVGRLNNLISCAGDGVVRYHQADNGSNFRNFSGATDFLYTVCATKDEKYIIAGGEDGILRVWNGQNGQPVVSFEPIGLPAATPPAAK